MQAVPTPAVADRSLFEHLRVAGVDARHDVDYALNAVYPAAAEAARHAVVLLGRFNPTAINAYLTRDLHATPRAGAGPVSYEVVRTDSTTCDMPILLVGGWYDSYTRATFQNFVGLGAGGRRPVRALVGPWTHGGKTMELSYAGDVEFGDHALSDQQPVHAGAPDPAGRVELELPAVRRESEYGGGDRPRSPARRRRQYRVP